MSKIKPRLAKGTRDFLPEDMRLRRHIISIVKEQFERFGFREIETPAVENLDTLTGKYGEEGDQLIFKILNSGDFLKNVDDKTLNARVLDQITPLICEKALRYDLTVPFARFVVQNRNELTFPFKRFQIQPVWRADRPQKGRYREFYQCDADVIGTESLSIEAEMIEMISGVFNTLEIPAAIHMNSRKILKGFAEEELVDQDFTVFTTILDKLDKKPWEKLKSDFSNAGFTESQVGKVEALVNFANKEFSLDILEKFKSLFSSPKGNEGIDEMIDILALLQTIDRQYVKLFFNPSLARGLNYYTGTIIEVVASEEEMGSICGGGRYDDLTGIFGMDGVSGMGISFGIDRIFDILKGREKIQEEDSNRIVCLNFGVDEVAFARNLSEDLRALGLNVDVYPDQDKIQKQFKYANNTGARFALIIGESELKDEKIQLKDLRTGEQNLFSKAELINHFSN